MRRHRSKGAHIEFSLESSSTDEATPLSAVTAFTTRPETLYGVTFLAVSPEHPLASMTETVSARHPLTKERIPLVVGEHVLADYGTGVVMGVPAHDDRDAALASHLGLHVRDVLDQDGKCINSGPLDGLPADAAREKVFAMLRDTNCGEPSTNYRCVWLTACGETAAWVRLWLVACVMLPT